VRNQYGSGWWCQLRLIAVVQQLGGGQEHGPRLHRGRQQALPALTKPRAHGKRGIELSQQALPAPIKPRAHGKRGIELMTLQALPSL
jgi:hypothetical protein